MSYKQIPGAPRVGHMVSVYCGDCRKEFQVNLISLVRTGSTWKCAACVENILVEVKKSDTLP